jgi:arylsulfatase A-like enzyme
MDPHHPYGRWDEHLLALRGDTNVGHVIYPGEGYVKMGRQPASEALDAYDANVRSADEQINRLLSVVDEEAVVAITGDHGEEFGRYNEFHVASCYGSMTQVPIIIRAAGLSGRERVPAQHLDIPPTLLKAIDATIPPEWRGTPLQTAERDLNTPIFFQVTDSQYGVRRGSWKLIVHEEVERTELYQVEHMEKEGEEVGDRFPEIRRELLRVAQEQVIETREAIVGLAQAALESEEGQRELSQVVIDRLRDLGYLE